MRTCHSFQLALVFSQGSSIHPSSLELLGGLPPSIYFLHSRKGDGPCTQLFWGIAVPSHWQGGFSHPSPGHCDSQCTHPFDQGMLLFSFYQGMFPGPFQQGVWDPWGVKPWTSCLAVWRKMQLHFFGPIFLLFFPLLPCWALAAAWQRHLFPSDCPFYFCSPGHHLSFPPLIWFPFSQGLLLSLFHFCHPWACHHLLFCFGLSSLPAFQQGLAFLPFEQGLALEALPSWSLPSWPLFLFSLLHFFLVLLLLLSSKFIFCCFFLLFLCCSGCSSFIFCCFFLLLLCCPGCSNFIFCSLFLPLLLLSSFSGNSLCLTSLPIQLPSFVRNCACPWRPSFVVSLLCQWVSWWSSSFPVPWHLLFLHFYFLHFFLLPVLPGILPGPILPAMAWPVMPARPIPALAPVLPARPWPAWHPFYLARGPSYPLIKGCFCPLSTRGCFTNFFLFGRNQVGERIGIFDF